jgi:hypothetical protein
MPIHFDKVSRSARRDFSVALMSDTKWRKLFNAVIDAHAGSFKMTVKFIDAVEPQQLAFPPNFQFHPAAMDTIEFGPVEYRAIEWLEFPIDLEPLLKPLGQFPTQMLETGTRVIGYRP